MLSENLIEVKLYCADHPNLFNDHFLKIGDEVNYTDTNIHTDTNNYVHFLGSSPAFSTYLAPTDCTEIENYLNAPKTAASGYDDISPKVLRYTSVLIAIHLKHIINHSSLRNGVFPDDQKKAKVVPAHKSGSRTNINNYRPITILPAFSKKF